MSTCCSDSVAQCISDPLLPPLSCRRYDCEQVAERGQRHASAGRCGISRRGSGQAHVDVRERVLRHCNGTVRAPVPVKCWSPAHGCNTRRSRPTSGDREYDDANGGTAHVFKGLGGEEEKKHARNVIHSMQQLLRSRGNSMQGGTTTHGGDTASLLEGITGETPTRKVRSSACHSGCERVLDVGVGVCAPSLATY
jgi:hypothetical protein